MHLFLEYREQGRKKKKKKKNSLDLFVSLSFSPFLLPMPLAPPFALHDLAKLPDKNTVEQLQAQAIAVLNDDTASVDDMRVADEQARRILADTFSRVHYLVLLTLACSSSDQALVKMTKVVFPGSISGDAMRLVVEVLAANLGRYAVPRPFIGSIDRLDVLVERELRILAVALIYARTTSYLSLEDLAFQTLHLSPFTCAPIEDFHQVTGLWVEERAARVADAWNAQLAIEDLRHRTWIASATALLLQYTPLPEVLVTLSAAYL
jgi:hypothetical protein